MKKLITLLFVTLLIAYNVFTKSEKENFDSKIISSLMLTNTPFCYSLYIQYHPNGQIKQKGCNGYFEGMSIWVGDNYEYDLSGHLIRATYYHPDEFGKDYKIVTTYDKDGTVLTKKIFNYDDLYETEETELNEIPQ